MTTRGEMPPSLGAQHRALPDMAGSAWLAAEDHWRNVGIPGGARPVAMLEPKLHPHPPDAHTAREDAIRVRVSYQTAKPGQTGTGGTLS